MPLIYQTHAVTQLHATVSKIILLAVALVCLLRCLFELDIIILEVIRCAYIFHLLHLFIVFLHFTIRRILGNDVFDSLPDPVNVFFHIFSDKVCLDLLVGPPSLKLSA